MARTGYRRACVLAVGLVALLLVSSVLALQQPLRERSGGDLAKILQTGMASIHANVTDDVGRPMENAIVKIAGNPGGWFTNASGEVTITDLPADTNGTIYTAWAEKPNYVQSPNDQPVLTPGNTSFVDLEIRGGVILGSVSDATGTIAGATVTISALGYSDLTDTQGAFRLSGIPGGTHSVTASATGYVNLTKDVVLDIGGVSSVDFELSSKTGAISGIIVHEHTFEPLEGANVSVKIGDLTVTVVSGADGSYRIPGLQGGTYSVTATLDGFNTSIRSAVTVVSGFDTSGVNFELVEKPTRLHGVVRAGSILLVGVTIQVVGTNYSANSSVKGEYDIRNIPAGTYTINVSHKGYQASSIPNVVIPRGGQTELNIDLVSLPGGSLIGNVTASDSKQPLSGVEVSIVGPESDERISITNINGQFEVTGLASGNYTVRFVLSGYKPRQIGPITISSEGTVRLDLITMEPLSEPFGGFIFGFDLAHSMMILALFLTIIILALAVVLRIRSFEAPDKAPAVYDEAGEPSEAEEKEEEPTKETGAKEENRGRERKVKKGEG